MKKYLILLIAAVMCMNPMCSGAQLECEDELVYDEYVDAGSFTYTYENKLSRYDYLRIEIITNGVKTKKIIKAEQSKLVLIDDKEMWETSPVLITDRSEIIIYRVSCEYVY